MVDEYKGTGEIVMGIKDRFPQEIIKANRIIGKTWLIKSGTYMDTDTFKIMYSSIGVHVVPIYPKSTRGDENV